MRNTSYKRYRHRSGLNQSRARYFWVTVNKDVSGSTPYDDTGWSNYAYKNKLPTPDCKVDTQDLATVVGVFGSCPRHPKWSPICDITGDYKVDIQDLARISAKFGWHG
jgi:hypothetical protein